MTHLSMRTLSIFLPPVLCIMAGCTLAPDYERPEMNLPAQTGVEASTSHLDERDLPRWWEYFDDAQLNTLVEQALNSNADLAMAAERILESRAVLGENRADYIPTLGGGADASRSDTADTVLYPGVENPSSTFFVSGLLNYEVDLFGRIRSSTAAARERLFASTYGYYSVRNALIAQTVLLYFQGVAVEEQIHLAEQTIQTRRDALEVQQKRYDSGFIPQLTLQQTKAELADAQVRLPSLRELLHTIKSSLFIITGTDPQEYWNRDAYTFSNSSLPQPPEFDSSLLPASLLERRPDILAAEADLKAAYQAIGIARAQRWPTLSVYALLGTVSSDLDDLFTDPAATWTLSGSASGPIYDFGRSRNRIRASEAQRNQAAWNYRQVVLEAFGEVNDAIASIQYRNELVEARKVQLDAFSKTLELAQYQYQEGYSDYLELLDAERRSFDARLALVEARYSQISAYITLCKALGGGWDQQIGEVAVREAF